MDKLATDGAGVKGDRDLLVVLALLLVAGEADLVKLERVDRGLSSELRYAPRSGLTTLSSLPARPGMPPPEPARARISALLRRPGRADELG